MKARLTATTLACTAVATLAAGLVSAAPADAHHRPDRGLAPHTRFVMAADGSSGAYVGGSGIPNIDSVKSTVRTYYAADSTGIANKTDSPYIREITALEAKVLKSLPKVNPRQHKAIVFDADDTTLWNYDFEDNATHFNFDPVLNAQWVADERFPAVPGMAAFVAAAKAKGYAIFGVTGRPENQEPATIENLTKVGFPQFDADNFYTKPATIPDYLSGFCVATAGKCNTVEYKAGTRAHIESLGYDIALNVGDQWSDLQGGYADRAFKLPNPTYYLASPDIPGAPRSDKKLTPRTHFTMAPDGSSGKYVGGEGIPNVDSVKATIRTYYGADSTGIANKTTSPYIAELTAQERKVLASLKPVNPRARKAVVLDADDTTLWTYDMEDNAMHFNFDPVLQNTWVLDGKFPATPGMVAFVNAVEAKGYAVFGLTGRGEAQEPATLANLAAVGYSGFTADNFFTKPATMPSYVHCATDKCTTIEYKSGTRKHIERDLHYDIALNVGDQFSDLIGGYADRSVKLPNPTYYLP